MIKRIVAIAAALLLIQAPPARAAAAVSAYAGEDGRLAVMPLGDSLTRGVGDPMWGGYRLDLRARLAAAGQNPDFVGPWMDGNGDHEHAGTSGARIDQVSVAVPQLMSVYKPDVVIVMLGTNDASQGYEVPGVADRMTTLLQRVRQYRPAARVFVATVPLRGDGNQFTDQVNAGIGTAVASLADPKVTLLPVSALIGADPARELTADGVHLTPCGYARMAYLMWVHIGLSDVKPAGAAWPAGYWPWGASPGACA